MRCCVVGRVRFFVGTPQVWPTPPINISLYARSQLFLLCLWYVPLRGLASLRPLSSSMLNNPPPPAPPPLLMRVFVCNATDLISRVHKKCNPGWQGKSGYGIRAGRSGAPFFFQSKLPPPPPRRKHALPTYPLSKATSMQATTGEVGRGDCRGLMKPVKFYAGHPRSYLPSPMTQRDAVGPALGAVGACLGHSSKEKVCGAGSA